MKKAIIIFSLGLFLIGGLVLAPSYGLAAQGGNPIVPPICGTFGANLSIGSTDVSSGGNVSLLQNYLIAKGHLVMPVGVSTGYFGSLTKSALASYQASVGISPAFGYFGPITRAYINSNSCPNPENPAVTVSYMIPSVGPVGTRVAIYGSGFTQDNRVYFGSGGAVHVLSSNNGTQLYFTIPTATGPCDWAGDTSPVHCLVASQQIVPGNYQMSVENQNGRSSNLTFTVTSSSQNNNPPVINGVSGPTSLSVNQTGTWKVSATDPSRGTLSYSVNWGEPAFSSNAGAPSSSSFQQSATFTHSYSTAGTYTQTFTVKNSAGQQAQTSTTVQVISSSSTPPPPPPPSDKSLSISSLSPSSGPSGTTVTISGSGFNSTGNNVNFSGVSDFHLSNLSSSDGKTLFFNVPYGDDYPCFHTTPRQCEMPQSMIAPGNHLVSVTNSKGTSNSVYFTVSGGSSYSTY